MKGDLSRDTFDPAARYSAVRMQQGRVITDADFNEQGDITRHRTQRLVKDAIGPCGAPAENPGYALAAGTHALAVHAADANAIWIAGEDGVLLRSTNGGAAWTLLNSGSTRHLRAIARASNTGWVVGDGGTVLRTNNAGVAWSVQDAGSLQHLRGVSVLDAQHAWAVGDGGLVLLTTDGGATWAHHAAGVDRLHAVVFADALRGLAVGASGAIVQSADGGQSWTAVASGSSEHLRDVALSGSRAWAVGDAGTALRSTDGGATWSRVVTGVMTTLRAVRFRNANEGWAVGNSGTMLYSANGGASWTVFSTGNGQDLASLSVAGTEPAWAVGGGAQAWRLTHAAPAVTQSQTLPATSLQIAPGRCYVQGQLCELDAPASLANQPDGGVAQRLLPGTYLVYLRAWQRHISALEAPLIREQALGGPDTATRARQIAQVRALALPSPTVAADGSSSAAWNCDSTLDSWDDLVNTPRARLSARAEPQLSNPGLCEIATSAGYRRLENQLYRVEIHSGGITPTFKWSRENASIAYAVQEVRVDTATSRTTVRLAARGRDANLDLALHDRVELVDDDAELQNRAGTLFEYLNDGDDALELVLDGVPFGTLGQDISRHPVVRRWDHRPTTAGENALPIVEGTWTILEDGVQVRFEANDSYRPGDYWQIPARTASADVEWPRDEDGEPIACACVGIEDGLCRLGLVAVDGDGLITVTSDCRNIFPPLTQMTQLLYVGGDGQETKPGTNLPQPLLVRVARGALPVAGARVRFAVQTGGGNVQGNASFDATCDHNGIAQCQWKLGTLPNQRVFANLLDAGGNQLEQQVAVFCATAITPAQVSSSDGCEVTIGQGGNFPQLDTELLQRLMKEKGGNLCICFLPGTHELNGLQTEISQRSPTIRLSLHGCGPTAMVVVNAPIKLEGFAALEIRDLNLALQLTLQDGSDPTHGLQLRAAIQLTGNTDVRLQNLQIAGKIVERMSLLQVDGARNLRMTGCELGTAAPASAVIKGITGVCEITFNQFEGNVAFYGVPPDAVLPVRRLVDRLNSGDFTVPAGIGRMVFAHNQLPRLELGEDMLKQLQEGKFDGLFHTVTVLDNTFTGDPVLCAGVFLNCVGNHFTSARLKDRTVYGALVARRATASSNVAELFNKKSEENAAALWFLVSDPNEFNGAANTVFTQPQSTP
jgi:photosystem II stability/assembly factor-like uncharacterized protein